MRHVILILERLIIVCAISFMLNDHRTIFAVNVHGRIRKSIAINVFPRIWVFREPGMLIRQGMICVQQRTVNSYAALGWLDLCSSEKHMIVKSHAAASYSSSSPFHRMPRKKLKIDFVHNNAVMELLRTVRSQFTGLISGLGAPMSLVLSDSLALARHKLQVDSMIIQAIDKELNTYAMRVRECSMYMKRNTEHDAPY